jgi:DNA-binding MarR family transcriptional regulator
MWDSLDPRSDDSRDREPSDPRDASSPDPRDVFTQGLDLPRGLERERVHVHAHDYELRGSEVRTLATVGAFRIVPVDDLRDERGGAQDRWHGDLERLQTAGLIRAVAPLDRHHGRDRTTVVALTERGRQLLESHRTRDHEPRQTFYAGLVKSRELTHDAQLYRAYLRTAERLHSQGARLQRVTLDYELKRDYQRFLQEGNRDRSDSDGRPTHTPDEVRAWAAAHDLPMVDERVQFPDVRVEYAWPDGRRDVEDIEVTTPHYRGAHAAAKARSGFTRFRASGGRVGGRVRQGSGGRSPDPHLAEEFLE